jgi:hypothetical protein
MGQKPDVAGYTLTVGYVPVQPTWHHKKQAQSTNVTLASPSHFL